MSNNPQNTPKKTNISEFIRVFRGDWLALMSGSFSIPFVYLGAINFCSQKDLFYWLAIISLMFSAYRLWAKEREKIYELENSIKQPPKQPVLEQVKNYIDRKIGQLEEIQSRTYISHDGLERLNKEISDTLLLTIKGNDVVDLIMVWDLGGEIKDVSTPTLKNDIYEYKDNLVRIKDSITEEDLRENFNSNLLK